MMVSKKILSAGLASVFLSGAALMAHSGGPGTLDREELSSLSTKFAGRHQTGQRGQELMSLSATVSLVGKTMLDDFMNACDALGQKHQAKLHDALNVDMTTEQIASIKLDMSHDLKAALESESKLLKERVSGFSNGVVGIDGFTTLEIPLERVGNMSYVNYGRLYVQRSLDLTPDFTGAKDSVLCELDAVLGIVYNVSARDEDVFSRFNAYLQREQDAVNRLQAREKAILDRQRAEMTQRGLDADEIESTIKGIADIRKSVVEARQYQIDVMTKAKSQAASR